jgi:hypothetical protein
MKRTSILMAALLIAPVAMAQLSRTAVSINGSDSNPCSPAAPCRSFAAAIAETSSGGELIALDSGGYGPFTIDRGIAVIAAPGAYAGVTVTSGTGITVSGGASDRIVLRNLVIDGMASASIGIQYSSGAELDIENCQVNAFSFSGIFSGGPKLYVSDTVARSAGSAFFVSGDATAVLERCQALDSNDGFTAREGSTVLLRDSLATGNNIAVKILGRFGGTATMFIKNCVVAQNHDGIIGSGGEGGISITTVSNTMIVNNTVSGVAIDTAGCQMLTFGNNRFRGNGASIAGFTGPASQS